MGSIIDQPLDSGPMKQRVIAVGSEDGPLRKLDRILGRVSVEVHRVPMVSLALEMLQHFPFVDLLLVSYPLEEMEASEVVAAVDKLIPSSRQPRIVFLAPEDRIESLARELPKSCIVVSTTLDAETLEEAASTFFRKDPRPPARVMVRIDVELGIGRLFRLVQSVNLSESGMLIRITDDLPLGTRTRFEFSLPTGGEPIRGEAEVVRHTVPDVERVRGLGFRFVHFVDDGRNRLKDYLDQQVAVGPPSQPGS